MAFEQLHSTLRSGISFSFQIPHEIAKASECGILLIEFCRTAPVMADEPHVEFRVMRNQAASFEIQKSIPDGSSARHEAFPL